MSGTPTSTPGFPKTRAGYHRSSVDSYVRDAEARLARLTAERAEQDEELRRLGVALAELQARYDRLASAPLDERAQDVLDAAAAEAADLVAQGERTAQDLVAQAHRRVEIVEERARQELAWRRRQLNNERAELGRQKLAMRAQLSSFRALAVDAVSLSETRPQPGGHQPSPLAEPDRRQPGADLLSEAGIAGGVAASADQHP